MGSDTLKEARCDSFYDAMPEWNEAPRSAEYIFHKQKCPRMPLAELAALCDELVDAGLAAVSMGRGYWKEYRWAFQANLGQEKGVDGHEPPTP